MVFSSGVIGGLGFYLVIAVLVFVVVRAVTADVRETIAWRARFGSGIPSARSHCWLVWQPCYPQSIARSESIGSPDSR